MPSILTRIGGRCLYSRTAPWTSAFKRFTQLAARDYSRAAYAGSRYREYLELSQVMPNVLTADINNVTCGIGSVFDLDTYLPTWQQTTRQPVFVGVSGHKLACIGQVPTPLMGLVCGQLARLTVPRQPQSPRNWPRLGYSFGDPGEVHGLFMAVGIQSRNQDFQRTGRFW